MATEKSRSYKDRARRVREWAQKESVRDNLLASAITAVGLVVLSALITAILSLTETIQLDGSLPIWLFIGGVATAALLGAIGGAFLARYVYFSRRVRKAEREQEASRERLRQSLLYVLHVKALAEALQEGRDDIEKDILRYAAETIKEATGNEVSLSICAKGKDSLELEAAPHHNEIEQQDIEVPHKKSWIIFSWGQTPPTEGLPGIDDLSEFSHASHSGEDLKAMVKHGHKCLKIATIDDDGTGTGERSLIALAKQPAAFSNEDLLYLEFLARILSLNQNMRSLRKGAGGGVG